MLKSLYKYTKEGKPAYQTLLRCRQFLSHSIRAWQESCLERAEALPDSTKPNLAGMPVPGCPALHPPGHRDMPDLQDMRLKGAGRTGPPPVRQNSDLPPIFLEFRSVKPKRRGPSKPKRRRAHEWEVRARRRCG